MAYITYKTLLGFIFADYLRFYVYLVEDVGLKLTCFDLLLNLHSKIKLLNYFQNIVRHLQSVLILNKLQNCVLCTTKISEICVR